MKKIILISDGWRRLVTYAWVAGIMREIRKRDLDIALYQYNSYGNWSKDALHNIGEYNIYNLPDFSEYDGVILDCSNISDQRNAKLSISCMKPDFRSSASSLKKRNFIASVLIIMDQS